MFDFLLFGFSGQDGLEEKGSQYGKENNDFQEYQNPQRSPPSHVLETVLIEVPNVENCAFHIFLEL